MWDIKHTNECVMNFSRRERRKNTKKKKNFEEFMVKHFTNLILFNFMYEKQKYINSQNNNNKLLEDKEIIKGKRER